MISLRPYQREASRLILNALANGQTRQLVVLPTGTGKTVVFVHLAAQASRPVLIIAHRRELLAQTIDKLVTAGINREKIGRVEAERDSWDKPFVVASIQSLWPTCWSASVRSSSRPLIFRNAMLHRPFWGKFGLPATNMAAPTRTVKRITAPRASGLMRFRQDPFSVGRS